MPHNIDHDPRNRTWPDARLYDPNSSDPTLNDNPDNQIADALRCWHCKGRMNPSRVMLAGLRWFCVNCNHFHKSFDDFPSQNITDIKGAVRGKKDDVMSTSSKQSGGNSNNVHKPIKIKKSKD